MTTPNVPEFARPREAARICGLSRATIYRLAGDGKIVMRKSGRSALVDLATVRAHLAALPEATIRPASSSRATIASA